MSIRGKTRDKKPSLEVSEAQKTRDEVLRLYVNGKSLTVNYDELILNEKHQRLVSDIAKYWLIKHGCRKVTLQPSEHYGIYSLIGIVLGLALMLIILYYLPV